MAVFFWTLLLSILGVTCGYSCPELCQCTASITNCKQLNLENVPQDIDENVEILDLSINKLTEFPSGDFYHLEQLNLSYNQISSLRSNAFIGMKMLKYLDLSHNSFVNWNSLYPAAFNRINLTYLNLASNNFGTPSLPLLNKWQMHRLEILRLSNCSMSYFNIMMTNNFPMLRELHLSDNQFVDLNDNFTLPSLKYLDLSNSRIKSIKPRVFFNLPELETLNLRGNNQLKHLTIISEVLLDLDLSYCALETIPKGRLRKLQTIDLKFNLIRELIDDSFLDNYPNLEIVDLSNNAITNIWGHAFDGLTNIKSIDLSFNKITNFQNSVFNLNSSLEYLNLSRNYISNIECVKSASLISLDISFCEIGAIGKYSLNNLPHLKYLKLSRNQLVGLPDGLEAENLQELDVCRNRIKSINNRTFINLPYLRKLNLASNQLTTISPSYFPKVLYISLEDNPWKCDCLKLKSMFESLQLNSEDISRLICESPERYAGQTWLSACYNAWHPEMKRDTLWIYSVSIIITMIILLVALIFFRKIHQLKELRLRQLETTRRAEEREALRRMRRLAQEQQDEEERNAPDPRETQRPPSYSEAVLMPPLDASHPSLAGSLHSIASRQSSLHASNPDVSKKNRSRRKRRRRKSDSSADGLRSSRIAVDSDSATDEVKDIEGNRNYNDQLQRRPEPLESDF